MKFNELTCDDYLSFQGKLQNAHEHKKNGWRSEASQT